MINFRQIILFFINIIPSTSVIISGKIPTSLNGKKILLNGPTSNTNYATEFDGTGTITSVVFENNEPIISTVEIPSDTEMVFPLSDFIQRDYFKLIMKLPWILMSTKHIQSGTRNTAVQKFNNKYYAVEESCKPIKLEFDNNRIKLSEKSISIDRMAAHMLDKNTIFSYTAFDKYPLRINNTQTIPWSPIKQPAFVHDGRTTDDNKYHIFTLTSTGLGCFAEYLNNDIDIPFDPKLNKAGWIIHDIEKNECKELFMNEYADLFHIAHIEHIFKGIYKIYAPFIYGFNEWIYNGVDNLEIKLKEIIIDLNKFKVLDITNTDIRMDFINKLGNELIGCSITKKPYAIFYNILSKNFRKLKIPGGIVREIIPFKRMLLYFSHELNNTITYLYIICMETGDIISKILVPNRQPGFHTTFFD